MAYLEWNYKLLYTVNINKNKWEREMVLYTLREAATVTKMSLAFWRQKVWRREVKFMKIGRSVRIPQSTIDELLARSIVEPRRPHDTRLGSCGGDAE